MKPWIIFFDIDGTLLKTGGAGQAAMERALVDDFRISAPFTGVHTAGRTDRGIADEIFQRFELTDTPEERRRFMQSYLTHLPGSLATLQGAVLPGVVSLLKLLNQRSDVVLTLLTGNYAAGARIKLQHFGLAEYFQSGGFGDHHACRNEVARQAATIVCDQLKLENDPRRMIVIGDTPADVQCARAIEAKAVAVATGSYSHEELSEHSPDHLYIDFNMPQQFVADVLSDSIDVSAP